MELGVKNKSFFFFLCLRIGGRVREMSVAARGGRGRRGRWANFRAGTQSSSEVLWFLICGLWFLICGLWFVVFDFWFGV